MVIHFSWIGTKKFFFAKWKFFDPPQKKIFIMKILIFPHENFNFSSWNLLNYFSFNCPTHAYLLYIARIFDLRKQGARRLIQTWQIYLESSLTTFPIKKTDEVWSSTGRNLFRLEKKVLFFESTSKFEGPADYLFFLNRHQKKFFCKMKIFWPPQKIFFHEEIFLIFPHENFNFSSWKFLFFLMKIFIFPHENFTFSSWKF